MAQEELQESKLTKAGGRKPTHGCNYPMVGWPCVILTPIPMGPSLTILRGRAPHAPPCVALSLSLYDAEVEVCWAAVKTALLAWRDVW